MLLPTTQDRSIAVSLSSLLGYQPFNQTASKYKQVFTLEGTLGEDVTIPAGTVVKTVETTDFKSVYFETEEDLTIPAGAIGNEQSNGEYLYTTTVSQGESIYDDVVGTSSGAPLQTFQLSYPEVIIDSIKLYVNEGVGDVLWTRVDSFLGCDADSTVYIATIDEFDVCTITFGNGINGKIPESYANGISASYKIGGGSVGNVSANTIIEMVTSIPYVASTFNVSAIVLGHDKESLESIKLNAPASFRSKDRLVTLQDYIDLLKIHFFEFFDISTEVDTDDKKLVHLYYYMRDGYSFNSELVESVSEFISARCMIGTSYDITAYTAQPLTIEGVAYVDHDYNATTVVSQIKQFLVNYFEREENIGFNKSFIKSYIEEDVKTNVAGVIAFRINTPSGGVISTSDVNRIITLASNSITITTQSL